VARSKRGRTMAKRLGRSGPDSPSSDPRRGATHFVHTIATTVV
jgi:hypothetical protein